MLPYLIYNGQLLPSGDALVSADSRALRYGDGIFETIKVIDGRILFLDDHILRMQDGMRILLMSLPIENLKQYLTDQILKLLNANNTLSARVRITIWRAGSGFYLPDICGAEILFTASHLDQTSYLLNNARMSVGILSGQQKSTGELSNLKSLNSQLYVFAAIKGKEMGFDEMLICNNKGAIIESTSSSIFMVVNETLVTPPLSDGCIAGVMRKNILKIARHSGIEVSEQSVAESDLLAADEIWLTNVIQGIRTIADFNDKRYTRNMAEKMVALINQDS